MRFKDDQGRIYYEPTVLVYWEEGRMGIFRTLPEDLARIDTTEDFLNALRADSRYHYS